MAKKKNDELLTLVEVRERTGISMPTLLKYKKNYQDRIPSVGKGRKQRFPVEALPVFEAIKKENVSGKGGSAKKMAPAKTKKASSKPKPKVKTKRKSAPKAKKSDTGLLSLREIHKQTGINYQTLLRYVKKEPSAFPHEGEGRRRRYYPEAIKVFEAMRASSRPGRMKKKASRRASSKKTAQTTQQPMPTSPAHATSTDITVLSIRFEVLEGAVRRLEDKLNRLEDLVSRPMRIVIERE